MIHDANGVIPFPKISLKSALKANVFYQSVTKSPPSGIWQVGKHSEALFKN